MEPRLFGIDDIYYGPRGEDDVRLIAFEGIHQPFLGFRFDWERRESRFTQVAPEFDFLFEDLYGAVIDDVADVLTIVLERVNSCPEKFRSWNEQQIERQRMEADEELASGWIRRLRMLISRFMAVFRS